VKRFNYQPPSGLPREILCDDQLLIVDKPSGLLSNPGIDPATHDCALSRLRAHYGELHLVHRLDCDTSGLLVLARTKAAERALKIQWQERLVSKRYQALVIGRLRDATGDIQAPLRADKANPPLQVVHPTGKVAQTRYQLLQQFEDSARVALFPRTGRTHQLRVHMLSIQHPILGDPFYGWPASQTARARLCLHADRLEFRHPNGRPLTLESTPDF
jgi:tRNA pseudouridine32 synthase / 23S rRNA pseudouridine746 synthase